MSQILDRLSGHIKANRTFLDVVGRPFSPKPPCQLSAIETAQTELGFSLPKLLTDIYTTVANGGFGPGYGVMGVNGGFTDDQGQSVVDAYRIYSEKDPEDPSWIWPRAWLPICHWGCVVYSVVDCSSNSLPVYFMDIGVKEADDSMDSIIHLHKSSFEEWLSHWIEGRDLWGEVWG